MSVQDRFFGFPEEDLSTAHSFVETTLGTDEFEITRHDEQGHRTSVYAVDAEMSAYILRHGFDRTGMRKDQYAAENFGRVGLPIPEVLGMQRLDNKSALCLTERVNGRTLDAGELGEAGSTLNIDFREKLQAIHTTDVSDSRRYSFALGSGNGVLPKLIYAMGLQQKAAELYWGKLAKKHTDLDTSTFEDITSVTRELGKFSVVERRLSHGDLKTGNMLAAEGQITGVIDWARFEYGDPAYDLGMLHNRYPGAVDNEAHADAIGLNQDNLQERILYYALAESTLAIGFFSQQGKGEKVAKEERRVVELADEASLL